MTNMDNDMYRNEGGRVPPQAVEVEEAVVGAMLLEKEAIDVARPLLNPNDFYKPSTRHVYEAIIHLYEKGSQTDLLSVENELRDRQLLGQVGGPGYLVELTRSVSSTANIDYHAQILTEKSMKRRLITMGTEIATFCYDSTTDAGDALQKAISMLDEVTDRMYTNQGQFVSELMEGVVEDILARREMKGLTGIGTGYVLDKWTGGWQDGDLYIIAARPSVGKAQPVDSLVRKKDGWVKIGDLKVGDKVSSIKGEDSIIKGVFPQGDKDVYEVEFSDGRKAKCTEDHLWRVGNRKWSSDKVVTLKKLKEYLKGPSFKNRIYIPTPTIKHGVVPDEFPFDPWLIGFMIANGCLTKGTMVSTGNEYCASRIKECLPDKFTVNRVNENDYRIVQYGKRSNDLLTYLRKLGLEGKRAEQKFIPEDFKYLPYKLRLQFFNGLLDGDGYAHKHGPVRYNTSSKKLAEDVVQMARSFGCLSYITSKIPTYTYKGEKRIGQKAYRIPIRHESPEIFFSYPPKKNRAHNGRQPRLNIKNIRKVGRQECVCIQVSSPDSLYVTNDYVVTHNTAMILNASFNSVLFESINAVGFYSNLEMKNYDLIKRRLAVESEVNYLKMRDGKVSDDDVTRIMSAADKLLKGRLIVDDATSVNINEWRAKYKTAVRRHGVQFGVVDYLQLMAGNKEGNREQEIASIARGLKDAAKETNTPVIALSQLGRACENRPGAEPYLSDMRESGELENSADGVILLNRPEFFGHKLFRDTPTKNKGWVKVAKMRNGMTGEFTMNFNKTYAMWQNEYGQYEKFQASQELDDEEPGEEAPNPHSMPDNMDEGPGF